MPDELTAIVAIASWPRAFDPRLVGGVYLPAALGVGLIAAGAAVAARLTSGGVAGPVPPTARGIDRAGVAAGAFVAVLAAYAWVSGWWSTPVDAGRLESWQRPLLLAAVAAVVGLVPRSADGWTATVRDLVEGLALGLAAALLVRPPGDPAHDLGPIHLACVVIGGYVLAAGATRRLATRAAGEPALPGAAAIAFFGAAIVLLETRNARLAIVAAALSTVALGGLVIELVRPHPARWSGGVPFAAAVLPALLAVGAWHDYGDVPLVCFGLVAASVLVAVIGGAAWGFRPRWVGCGIELGLAAALVAAAVLIARA